MMKGEKFPSSDTLTLLSTINKLERLKMYLQWEAAIENLSRSLESALTERSGDAPIAGAIQHFLHLKSLWELLRSSSCCNLATFAWETLLYWHKVLRTALESDFNESLKAVHWPMVTIKLASSPPPEAFARFKTLFSHLLKIELPEEAMEDNTSSALSAKCKLSLPIEIMLEPLRKRFFFHFMTKNKTNRNDKPEWYLTQILTWIGNHLAFMESHVQLLLGDQISARKQLICGLESLASKKLEASWPSIAGDDKLLSHTINEVLIFAQEISRTGFPPSIMEVLASHFSAWLNLEHSSALCKMDDLLSTSTAWQHCYRDEEVDENKVPECAERFMALIHTLTQRSKLVSKASLKLHFLDLQLELLDDFRLRLHQLVVSSESLDSTSYSILNAIHYIIVTLEEWELQPHFITLHCIKENPNTTEEEAINQAEKASPETLANQSVFSTILQVYQHMLKDLLDSLCEKIFMDVKAKSRPYRKDKWFCLPMPSSDIAEPSAHIYPMLTILRSYLYKLEENLAKKLFTSIWQQVALDLDTFFFEELILQSTFNQGGAHQLQLDMTRTIFPLFSIYTSFPESYFRKVSEAITLLTLNVGIARLLKETLLNRESSSSLAKSSLEEQKVFLLGVEESLHVLAQRLDL